MSGCVHRWRLEEPDGRPAVEGVCSRCGERRGGFKSFVEDAYGWNGRWLGADELPFTAFRMRGTR